MNTHYVYWYRLTEHSDPHRQGYVGITNDVERRHREHRQKAARRTSGSHFYNALNKYGFENVLFEVLHECTKDEALEYEFYYRTQKNIGWNSAVGGEDTLRSWQSKEVSLYHKSNPSKVHTFESATAAGKALGIKGSRILAAATRNSKTYGFDGWAVLLDKNTDRSKTISIEQSISIRVYGTKRDKPNHFKGMTNRWSDEERKRIGNQHKGKKLSKDHIESLRQSNRKNPKLCREIVLVHKDDPTVEYIYHSISEAARQLEVSLSGLKSKALRNTGKYGRDGWKVVRLGAV